jgi:hypothetical protein
MKETHSTGQLFAVKQAYTCHCRRAIHAVHHLSEEHLKLQILCRLKLLKAVHIIEKGVQAVLL